MFSDAQVMIFGGFLSVAVAISKILAPYLQSKMGVGEGSNNKELKEVKKTTLQIKESLRQQDEKMALEEERCKTHYKLTEKIDERLERLERKG